MPQSGFHGLVGLATVRAVSRRVPALARPAFAAAVVLGAMLPDIDMYPTVVAVLTKADGQNADAIVYAYHRTASHSVFVILLLALVGVLVRKKPTWSWAFWGLSLGTLTHLVLDVFFWFAQLDAMWPLSRYPREKPLFNIINIWGSDYKGNISNVRDACEFLAFALLLGSIRRIAVGREGVSDKAIKFHLIVEWILWGCWLIALVTAFKTDPPVQQRIVNAPYLLFFLPYCWSRVWVYRHAIADWGARENGWRDWDGTVSCDPKAIEAPKSEGEVVRIVRDALRDGRTVRSWGRTFLVAPGANSGHPGKSRPHASASADPLRVEDGDSPGGDATSRCGTIPSRIRVDHAKPRRHHPAIHRRSRRQWYPWNRLGVWFLRNSDQRNPGCGRLGPG